jgi:hypothetical protein
MDDDCLICEVLDREFHGSDTYMIALLTPAPALAMQSPEVTHNAIFIARIAAEVCRKILSGHGVEKYSKITDRTDEVAAALLAMTPAQRDQVRVLLDSMSDHGG